MNPQYDEGDTQDRFKNSGHVNQNDHAALYGIIYQAAVDDKWNQFVQAVATNATNEALQRLALQTKIPILVDGENGLQLSYDGGPLLSELGNSHVLVDDYDESLNQLIRVDETPLCVPFESVPCSRFIEVFQACGWMENVTQWIMPHCSQKSYQAETVEFVPENLRWLTYLPDCFRKMSAS